GAQPDRARAVPPEEVRRGDRGVQEGARCGSRRSAGALQPDAVLPRARTACRGRARADAVPALQGRRVVAVHHRPVPPAIARRQQRAAIDSRASIGRRAAALRPTLTAVLALTACSLLASARGERSAAVSRSQPGTVTFSDITASSGLRFIHNNGAFGKK